MIRNQRGLALVKLIPVIIILIVLAVLGLVISTFFDGGVLPGQNEGSVTLNLEKLSGTTYIDGNKQEVFIMGSGYGTLTCSSSNFEYANCYIEASTLVIIPGEKAGEAVITVTESNEDTKVEYVVTNKKQEQTTTKETTLNLSSTKGSAYVSGSSVSVTISGENYGKLSCTSSNTKIATCTISGTTLTIKPGTTAGTATITVTEASAKKTVKYTMTVSKKTATTTTKVPTTTTQPTVTLSLSATSGATIVNGNSLTATISGKNYGKLTCTSSNTKIATCSISGTKLTVKPVAVGEATITVKEGKKSKTVTYKVTVENNVSLYLSNNNVLTYVGKEVTETINGTNYGTLSCATSNDKVATCSIVDNKLTVKAIAVGEATITVKEAKTNKTVAYAVKVSNRSDLKVSLSLSSTSGLTYTGGNNIDVAISGKDYGQLSCKTNNSNIATCSITGNTLTIKPGTTSGNTTITVTEGNKNVFVTYKVSNKKISLSLSSTYGTGYIGGDNLKITIKGSDYGTLSCDSADEAIATCSISGNTLVITPGTKVGASTITVRENIGNLIAEYNVNINEYTGYNCTTGMLIEDDNLGYICVINSSVRDKDVCESYTKEVTDVYCSGSWMDKYEDDEIIIECDQTPITGTITAPDGWQTTCNDQFKCTIITKKGVNCVTTNEYYCPYKWKQYNGSNETLTCYQNATKVNQ